MARYRIGCGQITWRIESEDEILSEIAEAGYEGAPPRVREGVTADEINERFARHNLAPAPPYYGASFWEPEDEETILARARELAVLTHEIGCTELYVAAGGGGFQAPRGASRAAVAGHVGPEDAMSDEEFDQFARVLSEFGRITLEHGVHSCFHNHVGTVIETGDELDRLMERCDDQTVFLGLDTGHLAWAGDDPVAVCERYGDRIRTLHLKDIVEEVRQRGEAEKWDYSTFTANGIFTELGEGCVDFPAIKKLLDAQGFEGWLIVETDVTQRPTALESARVSREYLASIGL